VHRPEFEKIEWLSVPAGSLLNEEHRAARVDLDRDGDEQQNGRTDD
jgi:hypothetical protein